jgi:hypothetical protein
MKQLQERDGATMAYGHNASVLAQLTAEASQFD